MIFLFKGFPWTFSNKSIETKHSLSQFQFNFMKNLFFVFKCNEKYKWRDTQTKNRIFHLNRNCRFCSLTFYHLWLSNKIRDKLKWFLFRIQVKIGQRKTGEKSKRPNGMRQWSDCNWTPLGHSQYLRWLKKHRKKTSHVMKSCCARNQNKKILKIISKIECRMKGKWNNSCSISLIFIFNWFFISIYF